MAENIQELNVNDLEALSGGWKVEDLTQVERSEYESLKNAWLQAMKEGDNVTSSDSKARETWNNLQAYVKILNNKYGCA